MPTTPTTPCPQGQPSHFWLVEEANGPLSWSLCQYCGEERYQRNSIGQGGSFATHNEGWFKQLGPGVGTNRSER